MNEFATAVGNWIASSWNDVRDDYDPLADTHEFVIGPASLPDDHHDEGDGD